MNFTPAEIGSIGRSGRGGSRTELRRMLAALDKMEFSAGRGSPLRKLCESGANYGWTELERAVEGDKLEQMSVKARRSLQRHLRQTLERITRPSLELEWTSFVLALDSLGLTSATDRRSNERMFLRDRPSHRLAPLFDKFPVLARLWCLAVRHWRDHVLEVLRRMEKDRVAISRFFFDGDPYGRIKDLRPGLSDPHHGGRSVTLIEFERGRLICKPRSGRSESIWFSVLRSMNDHGFQPKLKVARVLEREGYYWMEHVQARSCRNEGEVRRFYERLGGLIAAAYLLKAVDCHRENLIAAGEHPVLVDIDALWHVSPLTKTQSLRDVLHRTGFFPSSKPRSLQSRSSVLGPARTGSHLVRIGGKPVVASRYASEIIRGFSRGWYCLIGTARRCAAFSRILRRVRARPRRWIYLATANYAALLAASVQPAVLRSAALRRALLTRSCSRLSVGRDVIHAEVNALTQLDLPHFIRETGELMPEDDSNVPSELIAAIRSALELAKSYR